MPLCHYIWYEDWKCAECCQGDRCNYYVTVRIKNLFYDILKIHFFTKSSFISAWSFQPNCQQNAHQFNDSIVHSFSYITNKLELIISKISKKQLFPINLQFKEKSTDIYQRGKSTKKFVWQQKVNQGQVKLINWFGCYLMTMILKSHKWPIKASGES